MQISQQTLSTLCAEAREQGRSIVFTNGCFDILHAGHVRYLAQAAQMGDILVLGLNSDASVQRLKGPSRPVNAEGDRAEVAGALAAVDYVCIFEEDTPYSLIMAVQPDVLVKGGDWKEEDIVGADIVKARGGTVCTIAYVEGRSTTGIIQKIERAPGGAGGTQ